MTPETIHTELGKIVSAEFGQVADRDFLFGLQLTFKLANGGGISSGAEYCYNICKACRRSEQERITRIIRHTDQLNKILTDAKCSHVSELVGKPVRVVLEDDRFVDFRILTEVL